MGGTTRATPGEHQPDAGTRTLGRGLGSHGRGTGAGAGEQQRQDEQAHRMRIPVVDCIRRRG